MNTDQLKQKLSEIDSATLQDFIIDLHQQYPELSDKIEALVLFNDPAALAKALNKRVQSLKRGRKFIEYHASYEFSRDLESLLSDIETGLLESAPKQAFELFDKFLATTESVFNRVDDSGGSVGEVYRQAVLLWLRAAKGWQDAKVDWLERVYQLNKQNDYGVLDPLLPNANLLLTEDQLKQLAWRYESELRKAIKLPVESGKTNFDILRAAVALGLIADALGDPKLYEHSILLRSPEPNHLQMKSICEKFLQYKQAEAALAYLKSSWEARFENDRLRLLDETYERLGNIEQLKEVRYQLFQNEQSYSSFKHYLAVLDEQEKATACEQAIKNAEQSGALLASAELLLKLEQSERAQALVLSRQEELTECFYNTLLQLAKDFENADCSLAATACYRALLLDILTQARSKAYNHAARYYNKLESMAGQIKDFKPLIEHQAFVQQLQQAHGRKKSFWGRIYPK